MSSASPFIGLAEGLGQLGSDQHLPQVLAPPQASHWWGWKSLSKSLISVHHDFPVFNENGGEVWHLRVIKGVSAKMCFCKRKSIFLGF